MSKRGAYSSAELVLAAIASKMMDQGGNGKNSHLRGSFQHCHNVEDDDTAVRITEQYQLRVPSSKSPRGQ